MKKHFVTFLSPGTFVSETNTEEISSWDVDKAVKMAQRIVQRYNARPYGFYFSTRVRRARDLDSWVSKSSGIYYLGGRVETREEVEARNDPAEETLRWNMRVNNIEKIVINNNSWKFTAELKDEDTILDVSLGEPTGEQD
jgi:hypothetical protein